MQNSIARTTQFQKGLASAALCLALNAVPASASELMWQSYDQPGFFATQTKSLQASELILTTMLQKVNNGPHPDDKQIVSYLEKLSRVCSNESKYPEAEQYSKLAVQFSERMKSPAQTSHLKIVLGNVLVKEHKLAQAEMAFDQALRLVASTNDRSVTSADFQRTPARVLRAQALFGLAQIQQDKNKPRQANVMYEKAMSLLKPEDGLSTSILSNYVKCLSQIGSPRAAEQKLLQVLQADYDDGDNKDSPAQAATLNNLAVVLLQQKKPAQAESYMLRAISVVRKNNYLDLPDWLDNLAALYATEKKETLAANVRAEADSLRKKTQPPKTAAASQAH